MAGDIADLLLLYKSQIEEDKKRLADFQSETLGQQNKNENCDNEHQQNNNVQQSTENKENLQPLSNISRLTNNKNKPLIERLDTSSKEGALEGISAFGSPDEPNSDRTMLRYGEYSPNNPQLRISAAARPYLGLGEYDQRRHLLREKRRSEYLDHLSKVQYDSYSTTEKELDPYDTSLMQNNNRNSYRTDQRLTSAQNALLKPEMDKPKSILSNRRTGSPRERLLSDLKHHTYMPSFLDGFSYQDRAEELERERIKRDNYQRELRMQIEEKRRMQQMRDEQERRQQELENKRLEQQLLRMQEEQVMEEQRRCRRDEQMRRHSEDLMRRKQELQSRFRKHTGDSESSVSSLRNTTVASKSLSHYSPPVSRRGAAGNPYNFNLTPSSSMYADNVTATSNITRYNPSNSYYRKDTLNRMDSLNMYDNSHRSRFNAFSRYDSLSRIDSSLSPRQDNNALSRIESLNIQDSSSCLTNVQRRHSATQQDLSCIRKSPKLQRRSSSSRFEDTLPIPVLKAHSPVAKELKNSVPFNSSRSDALRKLEDKWQIPAVQKNIINQGTDGQGRSILTQLGAIRMQLQQEQLRMDETLRKRDFTQSKAVDFH